jgi:homoserine dehydrogenase
MAAAGADGRTIRLVGSLWRDADGHPRGRVAPEALPPDHPLAQVDGAEKGATFTTDTLGRITVIGGASSPRGAAAALLRDVLHLASSQR